MSCQRMFERHQNAWLSAFNHDFLRECKHDTISKKQFDAWLVQDYLFVREFTRFAATLLTRAPYTDFDVLLGGLVALKDELSWFQDQAQKRSIDLEARAQEANADFCQFMRDTTSQPYAVQAVVFWSIEQAYNQAWKRAMPVAEPYQEFAERWGNKEFGKYCQLLQQHADAALQQADEAIWEKASDACGQVAQHEKAFWQMAYSA